MSLCPLLCASRATSETFLLRTSCSSKEMNIFVSANKRMELSFRSLARKTRGKIRQDGQRIHCFSAEDVCGGKSGGGRRFLTPIRLVQWRRVWVCPATVNLFAAYLSSRRRKNQTPSYCRSRVWPRHSFATKKIGQDTKRLPYYRLVRL